MRTPPAVALGNGSLHTARFRRDERGPSGVRGVDAAGHALVTSRAAGVSPLLHESPGGRHPSEPGGGQPAADGTVPEDPQRGVPPGMVRPVALPVRPVLERQLSPAQAGIRRVPRGLQPRAAARGGRPEGLHRPWSARIRLPGRRHAVEARLDGARPATLHAVDLPQQSGWTGAGRGPIQVDAGRPATRSAVEKRPPPVT